MIRVPYYVGDLEMDPVLKDYPHNMCKSCFLKEPAQMTA